MYFFYLKLTLLLTYQHLIFLVFVEGMHWLVKLLTIYKLFYIEKLINLFLYCFYY